MLLRLKALLFLLALLACGQRADSPLGFVLDQEHILTPVEHQRLDSLFRAHEKRTGNEIALVTAASFGGRTPVDFAVAFGDSIGVGKEDRDNGVVIAFSRTEHKIFIATGRGTERVLHDTICARIVEKLMVPHFKEDDFSGGLWSGSMAVVDFLERPENAVR